MTILVLQLGMVKTNVASKLITTLALFGLACFWPAAANEAPVLKYDISGSNAWYPYFIPDAENPGIVVELVQEILTIAQIPSSAVALPPKRTIYALKKGLLDFDVTSPSWFPDNLIPKEFVISDGMIEIKEYLVMLPKNHNRYSVTEDIHETIVGTVRGYNYKNDGQFERLDFLSEHKLVTALKRGRVDVVIMGDLPAMYWASQTRTNIVFGPLNSKGDLHIRLRKEHINLLPAINDAIAKLQQQGKIQALVSRYVSSVPALTQQNPPLLVNLPK